jgi:DNA-binding MarR family transcriptional regulator
VAYTEGMTRWLNDSEMRAWRGYIESMVHLMGAFEDDLVDHGLTMGDYEVLAYLSEAPEQRMRMCDLASALRLTASGLTRRLDGLVRMGAVAREACSSDRRVMFATLTDAGRALLLRAAPDHLDSVRRHFIDLLTPEQVQTVGDAFATVRQHLGDRVAVHG